MRHNLRTEAGTRTDAVLACIAAALARDVRPVRG
jgi:hypothetical protein